jgi:hypothetical protein
MSSFFSMIMTGKKEGDAYALQQVQKQGYELNEHGIIGRQYAFFREGPFDYCLGFHQTSTG